MYAWTIYFHILIHILQNTMQSKQKLQTFRPVKLLCRAVTIPCNGRIPYRDDLNTGTHNHNSMLRSMHEEYLVGLHLCSDYDTFYYKIYHHNLLNYMCYFLTSDSMQYLFFEEDVPAAFGLISI